MANQIIYSSPTFLTAEWRKLAIANYSIDPDILSPYLPYKTELDIWKGNCYISLVGFRFINTRLRGFPVPYHRNFEEINLRFYVRYNENGIWKRGVVFIKEIVPRRALAFIANSFYNEKYITLPTRHACAESDGSLEVLYEWKHKGEWNSIAVIAGIMSNDISIGSAEEFITEHYWGYTRINGRQTSAYMVEHPRWKVYPVTTHRIDVRFDELYGSPFSALRNMTPDSVMLAEGSTISVRTAGRIK